MSFGELVLLAVATNLDNLCLGLSYGVAKKHIPWHHNLLIALVTGAFGAAACLAPQWMPERFSKALALLGVLILLGTGLFSILQGVRKRGEKPTRARAMTSLREVCALSVALALNCLPVSFGVGFHNAPFLWLGILFALFSYVFVSIGNHLGVRTASLLRPSRLEALSGALLVAIALWERLF